MRGDIDIGCRPIALGSVVGAPAHGAPGDKLRPTPGPRMSRHVSPQDVKPRCARQAQQGHEADLVAGAFYANYVGVLAPTLVSMSEMGMVVAMAVIGGLGHRYGALVGVLVIRTLEHFVRGFGAEYTLVIITGAVLVVVLFFREAIIAAFGNRLDRAAQQRRWAGAKAS